LPSLASPTPWTRAGRRGSDDAQGTVNFEATIKGNGVAFPSFESNHIRRLLGPLAFVVQWVWQPEELLRCSDRKEGSLRVSLSVRSCPAADLMAARLSYEARCDGLDGDHASDRPRVSHGWLMQASLTDSAHRRAGDPSRLCVGAQARQSRPTAGHGRGRALGRN
jgi:hypothetical protein